MIEIALDALVDWRFVDLNVYRLGLLGNDGGIGCLLGSFDDEMAF